MIGTQTPSPQPKSTSQAANSTCRAQHESYLNTFPQYLASVPDDDGTIHTIHFAALFSSKRDAVPLARFHGWPCTFAEFFPVLSLLRDKYTPEDLPYHVLLPSLPGWMFSSALPLDRDWTIADSARIMHKLLVMLGFESGYVVQGGDIGASVARTMAVEYEACRAVHLNHCHMSLPKEEEKRLEQGLSRVEKRGLERFRRFNETGNAYGRMHGTRPATIGHVLSSSPVALLAWMGEKYLEWTDAATPIPLDTVLREVSLFWFTECAPTSIYPYREDYRSGIHTMGYFHGQDKVWVGKPLGYSYFPGELAPIPKAWVERTGNLVWCQYHERGGHYPSLEVPEALLEDVEDFLRKHGK